MRSTILTFWLALVPLTASSGQVAPPRFGLAHRGDAAAEEVVEVTLAKLMNYEWKQGMRVPKEIRELDGKKVRISGLMALGTLEGVSEFELVSDACGCGQSKMNHFVMVDLGDDTTGYDPDELVVEGTFEVGEEVEDGFVVSLYRLVNARIES